MSRASTQNCLSGYSRLLPTRISRVHETDAGSRAYVEELAQALRRAGVRVFYDASEKVNLWGKNLIEHTLTFVI